MLIASRADSGYANVTCRIAREMLCRKLKAQPNYANELCPQRSNNNRGIQGN